MPVNGMERDYYADRDGDAGACLETHPAVVLRSRSLSLSRQRNLPPTLQQPRFDSEIDQQELHGGQEQRNI